MAVETGINPKVIRNLNTVRVLDVCTSTKETDPNDPNRRVRTESVKEIFSGYLLSPVGSFEAEVKTRSLNEGMFNALEKVAQSGFAGKGLFAAASRLAAAGMQEVSYNLESSLQNGILYDRQFTLLGTNSFSKQFNCMLVTENDFFEDVVDPLYNLLKYAIPSKGEHIKRDQFVEIMDKAILEAEFGKDWQWAKDLLIKTWETAQDFVGDAWTYKKSDMLMPDHQTNLKIGNYITISDVLINKITFDIPELLYEGGLFDHVKVNFTVTGKRNVSLNTFDWINTILGDKETFDTKNKQSLNSYYK